MKEEEILQSGDKISCSSIQNKELAVIEQDLQQYYEKDLLNGLNLYLYGVILKEKNRKDEAKQVFLQSLNKSPMLWSAWLELSSLLSQKEADYDIVKNMRSHWMKNFYFASFHLEA